MSERVSGDPRLAAVVDAALTGGVGALDLEWLHGQGSRIAGFSPDSDVDLVAVCGHAPTERVLHASTRFDQDGVVLEKAILAGLEVDVMFVATETFQRWVTAVESGGSWRSTDWPDPLFAVAGLAHGLVLHDKAGEGGRLHARIARPAPSFLTAVTDGVRSTAPQYLVQMRLAADRGDAWLHQKLTNELTRMLHVLMFAQAGHYPPFPKYVSAWMDRLDVPVEWTLLYGQVWGSQTARGQCDAVAELTEVLLEPGPGDR